MFMFICSVNWPLGLSSVKSMFIRSNFPCIVIRVAFVDHSLTEFTRLQRFSLTVFLDCLYATFPNSALLKWVNDEKGSCAILFCHGQHNKVRDSRLETINSGLTLSLNCSRTLYFVLGDILVGRPFFWHPELALVNQWSTFKQTSGHVWEWWLYERWSVPIGKVLGSESAHVHAALPAIMNKLLINSSHRKFITVELLYRAF